MARFLVTFREEVVQYSTGIVEADSIDEAIQKAEDYDFEESWIDYDEGLSGIIVDDVEETEDE